jgi:hypothetical protein
MSSLISTSIHREIEEFLDGKFKAALHQFDEETCRVIEWALAKYTHALEGLAERDSLKVQTIFSKYADTWQWMLDWRYCRDAIERIPGCVDRFGKLSPILIGKTSDEEVDLFLREATRCYLYGFFQASIALARSALETGLNRHLSRRLGDPKIELDKLIDGAAKLKLLSLSSAHSAHAVRKTANKVLHGKPTTEHAAFDVLVHTRGVVLELYSS